MLNRNDGCWCGSGKKYKKCHLEFDEKLREYRMKGHIVPDETIIKTPREIEGIKKSAEVNTGILDFLEDKVVAGMSTEDIDKMVYKYTVDHGAIPAPLNYEGYPKSCCTSINNEVCHGIPDEKVILKDGDIINVDISTIKDGYFSDASRMFTIGNVSEEAKKLVEFTKECLNKGLDQVRPWGHIGDIGAAIQEYAHENGYSVVTMFGGHGIGNEFHEEPFVSHVGQKDTGMLMVPGMVFTIEPMINIGKPQVYIDKKNGWTSYTRDGSLSAQWEHQVLVTEDGYEIISH
ncbi:MULTISPECIES: methionyl aminopeptidase [Peptostreptococcus]|jgi:methionyl aminopeptidase|uniref:Methionine aminopeptidase n=1 Tax=Peptostreptococcus anaerobius 653-L TaxID=596329 RepID=D3MPU4_9FIRM|nr:MULTISPECIES: methionyl aminopeptidase [Peptostreptococcus]EFD05812.1 methionine aminopeptidase, type I [Peptostreptococcus anaerobius 653-L]KXB72974.1 methionine aminopeptidase, type I [Peptostreptococcus anaerobius]MBS5596987.1 methionyl aminopeptidase [Peptostreptococcus sp.]MCB6982150.1 methionyl aminopeptidase [Peptostreptococcus anaerobius]MCQ5149853.1 methionyl aminopeptidase [Peptostreptococcus anaerobius]